MNVLELLLIGKIGREARPKFHLPFFTFKTQKTFIKGGTKVPKFMNVLELLLIEKIGREAQPKFHLTFFTSKPQKNLHRGREERGTHVFSDCKVSLLGEENKRSYISS